MQAQPDSRGQGIARRLGRTVVWSSPFLLPILTAALAFFMAMPEDSDPGTVGWAFFVIPVAALLGACARAAQSAVAGESASTAWLEALVAAALGAFLAYILWWQALNESCHGRYECPF